MLPLGTPLPSEGLGEALPFGEGAGVRLLVKSKKNLHTQTLGGFFGETEAVVNTLTNNP